MPDYQSIALQATFIDTWPICKPVPDYKVPALTCVQVIFLVSSSPPLLPSPKVSGSCLLLSSLPRYSLSGRLLVERACHSDAGGVDDHVLLAVDNRILLAIVGNSRVLRGLRLGL